MVFYTSQYVYIKAEKKRKKMTAEEDSNKNKKF